MMIRHQRRHRPVRDADLSGLAEGCRNCRGVTSVVTGRPYPSNRGSACPDPRCRAPRPTGIWGADLGPFSISTTESSGLDLFQPDRRRQAQPAAHDDDVIFHGFANGVDMAWPPNSLAFIWAKHLARNILSAIRNAKRTFCLGSFEVMPGPGGVAGHARRGRTGVGGAFGGRFGGVPPCGSRRA